MKTGKFPEPKENATQAWNTFVPRATNLGGLLVIVLTLTYLVSWSIPSTFTTAVNDSYPPSVHLENYCASIPPISIAEYHQRQTALATVLRTLNGSAYIAEPGASAAFYGNVSQANWRVSERPLLLIITPSGRIEETCGAKISVLTPKFETTRAKRLPIPSEVQYIEWPEDANPYELAATALSDTTGTVFVDSSIRKFISDGLQSALPNVTILSAPEEIIQLRERKSSAELDILKCANEATLLAIRAVHKKLYIGIRESEARSMMAHALSDVGLRNGGCLTLFGENAALPHGSGADRALGRSDFALFDCTASLHGYYSDVTRTVALPDSKIAAEHRHIWNLVHSAQTTALRVARQGILTRKVDEAARSFLAAEGYASYFTHRLGHGIGLEVHEGPYLRGGSNTIIKRGHTFSDEPGIYIEGKIGVRLEDCFFIDDEGVPILLTEGVGGRSASPWAP
ncbi:putative peptidase M24B family protein [Lyophyllum shimeji]|uniref:Peptidase M24B family protein n=1 Tax=Lyophyllum shimeji TaxID=47721 RepID=A0A9P3UIZ3_LYOSH|nr:putative peptidase M24B family protein [Lyophyllum shimeji]